MSARQRVIIFGASARAAAFSALRAGLLPWCVDLFADADLVARCPATRLRGEYPVSFIDAQRDCPDGAWMYTGGMENYPRLITELASRRQLWGNDGETLRRCRTPTFLRDAATRAGLPAPELARPGHVPPSERYLLKPLAGAGGRGVGFWSGDPSAVHWGRQYLQEYIEGVPCSALYVGARNASVFLGATRQLIGERWLNAGAFQYCGSIGPLALEPSLEAGFRRLGDEVGAEGVRGLFGIDGVLRDGMFWPVELNPRYTASVEVIEYATGVRALDLHRTAFGISEAKQQAKKQDAKPQAVKQPTCAKAILFAPAEATFPAEGPWTRTLQNPCPVDELPEFADLPHAGDRIQQGWPVCTVFGRGDSDDCLTQLRQRAAVVSIALGWPGDGR